MLERSVAHMPHEHCPTGRREHPPHQHASLCATSRAFGDTSCKRGSCPVSTCCAKAVPLEMRIDSNTSMAVAASAGILAAANDNDASGSKAMAVPMARMLKPNHTQF